MPKSYTPTLFDRLGPDATILLRAIAAGLGVVGLGAMAILLEIGRLPLLAIVGLLGAGVFVAGATFGVAYAAGSSWKRLMVDGSSTPYVEQYSYQQALVMDGRVDDAIASFEALVAADAQAIAPRIRAAELHDRHKQNFARAAQLFREVQRIEPVSSGDFIYATNRLADLYLGPLGDRGRALVELRRLVERYPASPAADHARRAIAALKAEHLS